jgi:hypothetical protein
MDRVALRRVATAAQILWLVLFVARVVTSVPVARVAEWSALALAGVSLALLSLTRPSDEWLRPLSR